MKLFKVFSLHFVAVGICVVSFPNPLALESGLVERTRKNGQIWLWSLILRRNCIKPLVLGTSLANDTPKQPVSTAETSFRFILEPQLPHFCLPPVWDKIFLQFGTQFISPKLEEDTLAVIALWVMDKNSLCHQKISVYVKRNPNMCPTWCPQWEFSVKSGCEVQFGRF